MFDAVLATGTVLSFDSTTVSIGRNPTWEANSRLASQDSENLITLLKISPLCSQFLLRQTQTAEIL
jgi:hypothetical protein